MLRGEVVVKGFVVIGSVVVWDWAVVCCSVEVMTVEINDVVSSVVL